MLTISETVDTSKESVAESHENNFIRLNFPYEYSVRLGILWEKNIYCHKEDDVLFFSMFKDESKIQKVLQAHHFIDGGNPKSRYIDNMDVEDTTQYFLIDDSYCPFKVNDDIVFEYVREENDKERMVRCLKK